MTRFRNYLIFVFLLLSVNFSFSQNVISHNRLKDKTVEIKNYKVNFTDSILWKNVDCDDSKWDSLVDLRNFIQKGSTIFWLRSNITLKDNNSGNQTLSMVVGFLGNSYEIYWDGILINSNGEIVKDIQFGKAGKVLQTVTIPPDYTRDGNHILAIRVACPALTEICSYTAVTIGLNDFITDYFNGKNTYLIFIASIFFAHALFNLILFWGFNKNTALLYLTLFCLSQSVKTVLESSSILTNYNLSEYIFLMRLINPLVIIGGISLVGYLIYKFPIPYRKQLLLAYVVISVASYFLLSGRLYIVMMISVSFLFTSYALYKKYEGSILSIIGLIGFGIFAYMGYAGIINYGYFLGIIFFILCMSISSAKQISTQIFLRNQAVNLAARLESQLLKKNIQPHFILNSLSSLQELVEISPQKAVEFIDALADEFRIFSQISNEKLISIQDELKICEAHLKIMGFRKDSNFTLTTQGINGTEMVPPALFHTLVENGLTHGYGKKNSGVFILKKEVFDNGILYNLFNDSSQQKEYDPNKKGTGFKYVESRLEESYPGKWNIISVPTNDGWLVTIKIYN